jgi:hypothetical protein
MKKNRPRTIIVDGKEYAVLYVNSDGLAPCPFCRQAHKHGNGTGHRIAHCDKKKAVAFFSENGNLVTYEDGYYISY